MNTQPKKSKILAFYSGKRGDLHGRRHNTILSADDKYLAHFEDYIQWLFPLDTPSQWRPHAPILTKEEIEVFKTDEKKQKKLRQSLDRMLAFYGFCRTIVDGQCSIGYAGNFSEKIEHWLTDPNQRTHNFWRISRILRSLKLLGLGTEAVAFFTILEDVYKNHSEIIGKEAFAAWRKAIS